MAHCDPLGEASATMVEVENMDEAAIAAELDRVLPPSMVKNALQD
jgi:hypothetical protein